MHGRFPILGARAPAPPDVYADACAHLFFLLSFRLSFCWKTVNAINDIIASVLLVYCFEAPPGIKLVALLFMNTLSVTLHPLTSRLTFDAADKDQPLRNK